jgi:hypothetical protein
MMDGYYWNLSLIDMESDAFSHGCGDARFKLGFQGHKYPDHEAFADYAAGFDMTLEEMLGEEIGEL